MNEESAPLYVGDLANIPKSPTPRPQDSDTDSESPAYIELIG